jgi:hypothetical protein
MYEMPERAKLAVVGDRSLRIVQRVEMLDKNRQETE